jgi:sulfur-oxidizing protein SoxX
MKKILTSAMFLGAICTTTYAGNNLVEEGKKIFMTKKLGNCLACHAVNGEKVDGPGSFGPKLQYLSAWPEQALYDKVYDPYTTNPISAMPAFGKNGVLSHKQIEAVVAFLKTIK